MVVKCGVGSSSPYLSRRNTINYVSRDGVLQKLRSTIYTSGTHVRDFLLDSSDLRAKEDRRQFLESASAGISHTARPIRATIHIGVIISDRTHTSSAASDPAKTAASNAAYRQASDVTVRSRHLRYERPRSAA